MNLVGLTPLPSTAFEHRLRVDLRLRNPNPREYRIDGIRFRLLVNGERLASGQAEVEAVLPRLGEVVVPVTATTTLLDLVNQIVALGVRRETWRRDAPGPADRRTGPVELDYELTGRIFLAGSWGGIDFERRGSTVELAKPRASAP